MTFAEKPHLLVVDDDDRIRDLLSRYLSQHGFVVVTAASADRAQDVLGVTSVDMIILDVMMPGKTGVEWTRELRGQGIKTPILLLTAMGEVDDRIRGLEVGADDYLTKPFEPRELELRIAAILRRRPEPDAQKNKFKIGAWTVDLKSETLECGDGASQKLTAVDIKLLRALARQPGVTMAREELAAACGVNPDERTIDVQITRLRRKLNDDPKDPKYIMTVRGQGYHMMVDAFEIIS